MTYAETYNAAFNWRTTLESIIRGDTLILEYSAEHTDLRSRAGDWFSCACGQLDVRTPRQNITDQPVAKYKGEPLDPILLSLGIDFYTKVTSHQWESALDILDRIEEREAILLRFLDIPTPIPPGVLIMLPAPLGVPIGIAQRPEVLV